MTERLINIRGHQTHCCVVHGCKYGDGDDCPVENGSVLQDYLCESCGWNGVNVKKIEKVFIKENRKLKLNRIKIDIDNDKLF